MGFSTHLRNHLLHLGAKYVHRQNSAHPESGAGALPTAGGTGASRAEPNADAGGGTGCAGVELIGWRAWNLVGDRLHSLVYPCGWDGPVVHADRVPSRENCNGIYARRDLDDSVPVTTVWGEVALSGVVVEGEWGFRAEVATVRSLCVATDWVPADLDGYWPPQTWIDWPPAALLQALEARYAVTVGVRPSRALPLSTLAGQLQQQLPATVFSAIFGPAITASTAGSVINGNSIISNGNVLLGG